MKRFLNTYLQKRNIAYLDHELLALVVLLANNKQNEFVLEKAKEFSIELKRREILDEGNFKRYSLLSAAEQAKLGVLNEKISTMKTAEDGWRIVNSIKDFLRDIKHYYSFWYIDFGKGLTLGEWCICIVIGLMALGLSFVLID